MFGSVGRAAAGVDAEHHGLHFVVLSQFLQVFSHVGAYDGMPAAHDLVLNLLAHDVAVSIVDGHFLTLVFLAFGGQHLADADGVDVLVGVNLEEFADFRLHLVVIERLVDEFLLLVVGSGAEHGDAVSIGVQ